MLDTETKKKNADGYHLNCAMQYFMLTLVINVVGKQKKEKNRFVVQLAICKTPSEVLAYNRTDMASPYLKCEAIWR